MENGDSHVSVSSVQPCCLTAIGENRNAVTIGNRRGNLNGKKKKVNIHVGM